MLRKTFSALLFVLGLTVALGAAAQAQQMTSPPGAKVFITNLKDGDTVTSPFKVEFGIEGMTIAKAGTMEPNTGHHHLFIDVVFDPAKAAQPVPPNDVHHMHFGAGQTEAMVTLPPGPHTLQLVLADGKHVPHNPPVFSKPITITVK
jgi:hypothetical protein